MVLLVRYSYPAVTYIGEREDEDEDLNALEVPSGVSRDFGESLWKGARLERVPCFSIGGMDWSSVVSDVASLRQVST